MKTKEYPGDSVYAEYYSDTHEVVLTVEHGKEPTDTIYLQKELLDKLIEFVQREENK